MAVNSEVKEDLLYARILMMMDHETRNISVYDRYHKYIQPAFEAYKRAGYSAEDETNVEVKQNSTGHKMERWDAYDKAGHLLPGVTLLRGEPIPDGWYHLVCDILVRHTDGSFLLMRRAKGKHFGGLWEASAGGSALQGESPLNCAKRELFEETGIQAGQLTELGRVVHEEHQTLYVLFLCVTCCAKNSIVLQAGETDGYRWVSEEHLLNMTPDELCTTRMQQFQETWKIGG